MEDQAKPEDDIPEPGHRRLEQQRQILYYMRLIEHEMPKLVGVYHRNSPLVRDVHVRPCSIS